MAELERDLREVGRLLAFPPEPDLVRSVRARLGEPAPRGFAFARRRVLVLALAVDSGFKYMSTAPYAGL